VGEHAWLVREPVRRSGLSSRLDEPRRSHVPTSERRRHGRRLMRQPGRHQHRCGDARFSATARCTWPSSRAFLEIAVNP